MSKKPNLSVIIGMIEQRLDDCIKQYQKGDIRLVCRVNELQTDIYLLRQFQNGALKKLDEERERQNSPTKRWLTRLERTRYQEGIECARKLLE